MNIKLLIISLAASFLFPRIAFADDVPPSTLLWGPLIGEGTPNFPQGGSVGDIIGALLPYIFGIAGFLILIYFILGGYQILTSQNDPKILAAGQQKITYAIVGFVVVFVSYWLVQLIANILGLKPITDIF